ncbi:hypothetical protein HETIRDRAFT_419328 [Heterobasidion irregulare TC 32-1]|uniref:Uncharacterized protein n=1 Tax=Heterobasidion irregulare (strain TC 32-1) TaxID=747525 RepID=W4K1F4_HETIT|nr:uncharacterized protein HETIRDRAFT_419328 [Heterobasidion irregulare TC 32-1]ETW79658.1 hypothetical protein HETIRDRAFT_419328 [Heterobasidion irregulare TC 32-1]
MAGVNSCFFHRSSVGLVSRRSQVSSKSRLLVAVPSAERDLLLGDGVAGDTASACLVSRRRRTDGPLRLKERRAVSGPHRMSFLAPDEAWTDAKKAK